MAWFAIFMQAFPSLMALVQSIIGQISGKPVPVAGQPLAADAGIGDKVVFTLNQLTEEVKAGKHDALFAAWKK